VKSVKDVGGDSGALVMGRSRNAQPSKSPHPSVLPVRNFKILGCFMMATKLVERIIS
jgi:hypothetical protein